MKDYFGYKGKVCVITGAASGMGKAATEVLLDLGAEVYAMDWAEVTAPVKKFIKTDLSQRESIDAAFKEIPTEIDKFFGIAGVSGVKTDYHKTFTINFIANKYMTDEYLTKRMKDGGAIAYITSSGGLNWEKPGLKEELVSIAEAEGWDGMTAVLESLGQKDAPGAMAYIFAKRAMHYYAALMVRVFGEKKVRVNCVLPAQTQTGLTEEFVSMRGGMDKALESTGFAKRLADSREMGEPIVFLNSDMASYICGVMLDVDFGLNLMTTVGFAENRTNFKLFSR